MAYQKLQGYRAWNVNKSDNTDIPNIGIVGPSGTTTSAATNQLIDSAANFTAETVQTGMIVVNTTDGTQTTVLSIENTTTLNVTNDIMPNAKAYQLYDGNQEGAVLFIGTAGNLKVTTAGGDEITFQGINTGTFFPVNVVKVFATGTSADNIIALW
tara:strand:+ start:23 stop:490 length:468 start_codon:yes stop_codon:yes gene_type:complete